MPKTPNILVFAGSARVASINKKLALLAAGLAEKEGAHVTYIDLKDYPLPIYDEDLEQAEGLPPNALRLKELFLAHDALLMACPEYNSSITPLWKNTIDWISRSSADEAPLAAYKGKVAALLAASPGGFGGLRGLVHYRQILGNIGVVVLPDQLTVPAAHLAFAEDGTLSDPSLVKRLGGVVQSLVKWASCSA